MKTLLCALLFGGACLAADKVPQHVRVSIQYIEVPHPALTGWLGEGETGAAIHAKAMALAESDEAKILDTCMVVCRSGHKVNARSVLEEIYPREYDPEDFKWSGLKEWPNTDHTQRAYPAFETKSLGMNLEIQPTIEENDLIVDLRFLYEFTRRLKLGTMMEHKDEWGDGSLRMPIYENWRTVASLILWSGKSELVALITPEAQPPAPAVSRRVLLFVRADVIETR